jgi:hypothetical protein
MQGVKTPAGRLGSDAVVAAPNGLIYRALKSKKGSSR